jgi:mRNA interferase HigB
MATWASIVDVRKTYPHADAVDEYTVFNIKGNKYRLATQVHYQMQIVRVHWMERMPRMTRMIGNDRHH